MSQRTAAGAVSLLHATGDRSAPPRGAGSGRRGLAWMEPAATAARREEVRAGTRIPDPRGRLRGLERRRRGRDRAPPSTSATAVPRLVLDGRPRAVLRLPVQPADARARRRRRRAACAGPGRRMLRPVGAARGADGSWLLGTEPARAGRRSAPRSSTRRCARTSTGIVTLGAMLADVPHTRPISIFASSENAEVRDDLGIERSTYEGPVGILSRARGRRGAGRASPRCRSGRTCRTTCTPAAPRRRRRSRCSTGCTRSLASTSRAASWPPRPRPGRRRSTPPPRRTRRWPPTSSSSRPSATPGLAGGERRGDRPGVRALLPPHGDGPGEHKR